MNLAASRFLVMESQIYVLRESLLERDGTCSLWNVETLNWLRHFDGKVIESPQEETDLFCHDASFYLHELEEDYVWLSCTNTGMENMYVYHDRRQGQYVLRREQYTTFFLYSFAEMKIGALFFQRCDALERRLRGDRGGAA